MNILWLKTDIIYPPNTGGKLRTYWILKELSKRHNIIYCCFADGENDLAGIQEMKSWCAEMHTIERKPKEEKYTARFYLDLARNLFSPYPYAVGKYYHPGLKRKVKDLLSNGKVDCVVCDFIFPALNMYWDSQVPRLIFCHNVESLIWRRYVENHRFLKKWFLYHQYRKMVSYEFSILNRFDAIVAVSEKDKLGMLGHIRDLPVEVIGTGVNLEFFGKRKSRERRPGNIVFSGSMDWIPNEDSMIYFVKEIYPKIRKEIPHAGLTIVGRKPTPSIRGLASSEENIVVTGGVDDIRPFLAAADCFVVPLRIAGGTRLKIPEAMATGLAVVSTSVGAEGLGLTSGEEILIADTPQVFAEKVIRVIRDGELRAALEERARKAVEARFSWEMIGHQFEQIMDHAVRMRGGV
ncbi:MAG: hypothetical protein CO150_08945 [Nitrospirae bacterium CG_4_9_14_3_um_filter_53_35]|nr:MAG: hypothetical protein AUK29_09625 [Nitrospirae bacterium CG2_30_53_67]PJA73036.1 MAG: hypothetical protein CO150_08945 [Nitrospirae bacterium CG_4_9_14_3_um_filter_53_35]